MTTEAERLMGRVTPRNLQIALLGMLLAARGMRYRLRADVIRDISFGEHPRLRLDIYPPKGSDSAPVVMFLHGGRFEAYDKETHALVGRALRQMGVVGVLANYRLYPDAIYPAFCHDAVDALGWIANSIAEYGGDPYRIILCGHSAGAVITTLLALDGDRYGLRPGLLRGAITISGLYDYEDSPWHGGKIVDVMGGRETYSTIAQPIKVAGQGGAVPLLILHGEADDLCPVQGARALYRAQKAAGAPVEIQTYPRYDHYQTLFSLLRPRTPIHVRVAAFAHSV